MTVGLRAVLIDDDPDDLKHAARFSAAGLTCDAIDARKASDDLREELRAALEAGKYQVVLLDYRLDLVPTTEPITGPRYRGGTIAAEIRELFPSVPIALVTTEEKLKKWVLGKPKVHELFDVQFLKGDLASRSGIKRAARELGALAQGYLDIGDFPETDSESARWSFLSKRLKASDDEMNRLMRLHGSQAPSDAPDAIAWLMTLLEFKGPFLDDDQVRTRLGLTKSGFQRDEVQTWMRSARYEGPFSDLGRRWWRSRLDDLLSSATEKEKDRAKAIALAAKTTKLQAATCIWCGSRDVRRACRICSEAVDALHSVSILDAERPAWAEPEVVCFVCIRDGRAEDVAFDVGSEGIVSQLKQGKIEQKGQAKASNGSG